MSAVGQNLEFPCQFTSDPFQELHDNKQVLGVVIVFEEEPITVPTLWSTVMHWLKNTNRTGYLASGNAIDFLTTGAGYTVEKIRMCSVWTNFEVGAFSVFRSAEYASFFDHLDRAGGMFYERWGDAPVHTQGVFLFSQKKQIHRFKDIGYGHDKFYQWPMSQDIACHIEDPKLIEHRKNVKYSSACTKQWDEFMAQPI
jgi:hypothetical protein